MKLIELYQNNIYITQTYKTIKRERGVFLVKYTSMLGNMKHEKYYKIQESIFDNKLIAINIDKKAYNKINSNFSGAIELQEDFLLPILHNVDIL